MIVHKELKEIAELNKRIDLLRTKLWSVDHSLFRDCDLIGAYLVEDCYVENGHLYSKEKGKLDNCGLQMNEYYCSQYHGYSEDDFYGTLYFATSIEETFVAVPFSC